MRRGILGRGPVSAHKVAVSESLEVSPLLVLGGGNVVSILCVLLSSTILGCFLHPVSDLAAHALDVLPIIRLMSARPILAFSTRDLRSQHLNLAVALLFLELIDIFEGSFWRLRYGGRQRRVLECLIELLLAHSKFISSSLLNGLRFSCNRCIEWGVVDTFRL